MIHSLYIRWQAWGLRLPTSAVRWQVGRSALARASDGARAQGQGRG